MNEQNCNKCGLLITHNDDSCGGDRLKEFITYNGYSFSSESQRDQLRDAMRQQAKLTREETIKECIEVAQHVKNYLKTTSGIDEVIRRLLTNQNDNNNVR